MTPHPLAQLFEWFPDLDFAVLNHGLASHGRDYVVEVETNGTIARGRYQLTFTHVVDLTLQTRVRDDVWPISWDDVFLDYERWEQAGEPEGYVWGTDWSLAYPGLQAIEPSTRSAAWTQRIGQPMFEASLATDRFELTLVFHSIRTRKIGDDTDLISKVIIPFASPPGEQPGS